MRYLAAIALAACTPASPAVAPSAVADLTVILDGRCSAVVTGPRELTTAGHCVDGRQRMAYRATDGNAVTVDRQPAADLATLETDRAWVRVAARRPPVAGEAVTVVHHTRGAWAADRTTVLRVGAGVAVLELSPVEGMSGSGVWGDDGTLVCVVTGRDSVSQEGVCQW